MFSLLITNATIVNEGVCLEGDILIRNGRIEAIGQIPSQPVDEILDAQGLFVLPGMIDNQVHFREPGLEKKGDIGSESLAAIAGGITSFMDMPNTLPPTLTVEDLAFKKQLAQDRSYANYAFYMGAVSSNLAVIQAIDPTTICGIGVFIGSSCAQQLVDDFETFEQILKVAPTLVAAHCEDMPTIWENEESYRGIYGDHIALSFHSQIRSEEACWLASSQAVALAQKANARLHILHVSTARELALFSTLALSDKLITAEVCPQYLHFTEEDYETYGGLIKVNPALKTVQDRNALIQAVQNGQIDMIGSGHAPHAFWEKQETDYFSCPAGMPMVQDALLSLLEHYHDGSLPLTTIVAKTSHNVAVRFEIAERGFIREGYWADLVIVDLAHSHTAKHDLALAKCHWTPFDGYTFRSRIAATVVNGRVVWRNGQLAYPVPMGQALAFNR